MICVCNMLNYNYLSMNIGGGVRMLGYNIFGLFVL